MNAAERKELRRRRLLARQALEQAESTAFKPVTSAKWVHVEQSLTGVIRVQIDHDTIKGCTPQMIRWWFEHLGCTTTWNGKDFSGPTFTMKTRQFQRRSRQGGTFSCVVLPECF